MPKTDKNPLNVSLQEIVNDLNAAAKYYERMCQLGVTKRRALKMMRKITKIVDIKRVTTGDNPWTKAPFHLNYLYASIKGTFYSHFSWADTPVDEDKALSSGLTVCFSRKNKVSTIKLSL